MSNLKPVIAHNIALLRTNLGITQLELAEKLNYSDKAVSKWERGESLPDISVLKEIADLFNVTVDFLLSEDHPQSTPELKNNSTRKRNHGFITGMSILLVWLVAAIAFVILDSIIGPAQICLLPFLYAIPVTFVVWLILNSVWFNRRRNFLIVSMLMWSSLGVIYFTLLFLNLNIWLIFILGIPGQAIIYMWSMLRFKSYK